MVIKLFETYKSQRELEELTNDILIKMSNNIYRANSYIWSVEDNEIAVDALYTVSGFPKDSGFVKGDYKIRYKIDGKIGFYGYEKLFDINELDFKVSKRNTEIVHKIPFMISVLNGLNESKYSEVLDFIKECDIDIRLRERNSNTRGTLEISNRNKYKIILYFRDTFKKELSEKKKEAKDNKKNVFYSVLYYEFHSYLLHELVHAYDNYRSKGKALKKQDKYDDSKREYDKISEPTDDQKRDITLEYMNLPHEIDATFAQAIQATNFSTLELPDHMEYDYELMIPLRDVIKNFKSHYGYYRFRAVPNKYKRKMIRKISQYWHIEMEKIKEENKQKGVTEYLKK